jgi:Tfp pilus assembly protein FimT
MNTANAAREWIQLRNSRGIGLTELIIVLGMIGVLAVLSTPMLIGFWRAATLQAGAQELATAINFGRQLAISRNTTTCVQLSGTNLRLRTGGCGGTIWTGPGTDGAGLIRLQSGLQVSHLGPDVVFTSLGAANPGGIYRVTSPVDGRIRMVVVSASGRVNLQ